MSTEKPPVGEDWTRQAEKLVPLLAGLVAVSLVSVLAMQALGGVDRLRDWVLQAGSWAPLVYILLKASTYVVAPLSGTPLIITGGALFGTWPAFGYIVIGEVLGAALNFWIARLLGRPGIRRFAGEKAVKRVDETVQHVGGWRALLAASLLFSSLYDFISYAAGLSNLRFRVFFWVTLAGVIPSALLYAFVGDRIVSGGGMWFILGALVILGLVLGIRWWLKRRA